MTTLSLSDLQRALDAFKADHGQRAAETLVLQALIEEWADDQERLGLLAEDTLCDEERRAVLR